MDHVSFNASENGVSLGRWPDGNGKLFPMSAVTLSDANSGPVVSPIVISEVQYHPVDPAAQNQLDAKGLEFVELYNSGNAVLDIGSWRLDNAVDFTFDSPTTLGPDSALPEL